MNDSNLIPVPETAEGLPKRLIDIIRYVRQYLRHEVEHSVCTRDGKQSLGRWLDEIIQSDDHAPKDLLPKLSTFSCFRHGEDRPFRVLIEGPDGFTYFADGSSMNDLVAMFLLSPHVVTNSAMASAIRERMRQNEKWGEQNHDLCTWSTILTEECGEFAEAALHDKFGGHAATGVRMEAVQVAAVALQIVEFLDRTRAGEFLD